MLGFRFGGVQAGRKRQGGVAAPLASGPNGGLGAAAIGKGDWGPLMEFGVSGALRVWQANMVKAMGVRGGGPGK